MIRSVFPRFSYPDVNFWIWVFGRRYRQIIRGWEESMNVGGSDRRFVSLYHLHIEMLNIIQDQLDWLRAPGILRGRSKGFDRRHRPSCDRDTDGIGLEWVVVVLSSLKGCPFYLLSDTVGYLRLPLGQS